MELIQKLLGALQNIGPYVAALNGLLLALIAVCALIPGEQPEKALQGLVDLISKLSKK